MSTPSMEIDPAVPVSTVMRDAASLTSSASASRAVWSPMPSSRGGKRALISAKWARFRTPDRTAGRDACSGGPAADAYSGAHTFIRARR